ncbi:DUF4169 family protein [uncultured Jannaschia sp.]|uniref:DUF4169 family protein n=1 Tax=uncultured Jannaschia sp. TaxID=293347 RepID=UPI00261C60BF|nr:DUF4169 family protein [uncultured Jannaschia sp.]
MTSNARGDGTGGKVISLSRIRKARARDAKRAEADANAAKHGQPKAERSRTEAENAKVRRDLEAHRRDDPPENDGLPEDDGPDIA